MDNFVPSLALVCMASALSCAPPPRVSPTSEIRLERSKIALDTALFSAVAQVLSTSEAPGTPVGIDPRPLALDPSAPSRVTLAAVAEPVAVARAKVLERLGIPRADARADEPCVFTSGYVPANPLPGYPRPPPLSDSMRQERERCRARGSFSTFILGLPREGGAYFPPYIDERVEGRVQGYWTTRVIELTDGSYIVFDVIAAPRADGTGWQIIEKRLLERMWS